MNLTNESNELPFILFPQFGLKILVDTASTKSFVNPTAANKYFCDAIIKDPFMISTAHGRSNEDFSTMIDCSKLFNIHNLRLKFHIFKFHKYFDILIGLDNLKLISANVDLKNNILITPKCQIKLCYYKVGQSLPKVTIHPRSEQIIKLKVKNVENGDAILPHQKLENLEFPESLVKVRNYETFCVILNKNEFPVELTQVSPVVVEEFEEKELNCNELNFYNVNYKQTKFDVSQLRTDHMNDEEKEAIIKLTQEYKDIFQLAGDTLSFTNEVKHHIRTKNETPIYTKTYRYPFVHKQEVNEQIDSMLKNKIIRKSNSPWNSPIWIVPKKSDASGRQKWRIVIDFRNLNSKTIDDRYPLPNITDLLDKLGKCHYFSTIDLASGFHQVELDEDSIAKTAFSTEKGHFEFLRMPFGLKNAPRTFQRVMDNILRGIADERCAVYLDDIIVFSTSLQEHLVNLRKVFERLRRSNFKIQLDKTEFLRKEVAYLGHVVTPDGVKPNPDKIKAILKYPIPKTQKEIKSFLGLLGFYRRHIKDFAKITKVLTQCLKKNAVINVNDTEYIECFNTCKNLLMNEPILQYPDFSREFRIATDASDFAIGAVLSQLKNGSELPVAYASRTLNESETRLSTIEKELLAIVWAVKYFRPYLYGRKFKIFCDHKPLQWLFSLKEPNSKLLRWRLKLEEFDYEVIYRTGKANTNADALSRIELNVNETENNDQNSMIVQIDESEIIDRNNTFAEESTNQTIHSNFEGNVIVNIPIHEGPVNVGQNQIFISLVNHSPSEPTQTKIFEGRQRILLQLSKNHFDKDVINFVKTYVVPKIKYHLYFESDCYERFCTVLMKYFKESEINFVKCSEKLLDVTEVDEIKEIIENYHIGKTNHRGLDETENQIKRIYYWPNMRKKIQEYINKCDLCQTTKYDRRPLKLKYNITPTPTKPFEIVHIDTITLENNKFLSIIDTFSKYGQAYRLKSGQGIEVVKGLLNFFTHHNTPNQIISDNGLEINNSLVKEFLSLHKIDIHFISSQHPESNGPIERFHSTLIEHIRLLNNREEFKGDSIETKVQYAIIAYNNSIHSVTKLKPFEIIHGHLDPYSTFNIDIEKQLLNNYIYQHREKIKILYKNISELSEANKTKLINRRNESRENLPVIPTRVFVRNKQKQSKTKNKYQPEQIETVNSSRKIATITPRHFNTKQKVHLSNIKRPRVESNLKRCSE